MYVYTYITRVEIMYIHISTWIDNVLVLAVCKYAFMRGVHELVYSIQYARMSMCVKACGTMHVYE